MAVSRCPMCGSPCILKIIATEDENWTKVDVCEMCLTMYPRGREVVRIEPKKANKPKAKAKPKKKAKKK